MNANRSVRESQAQTTDLAERFAAHVTATGLLPEGAAVTVALSGGLDSVALLDLLDSLSRRRGWRLSAAHFDHRMRAESGEEAIWAGELCRERGVPLRVGHAPEVPANESEAREARSSPSISSRVKKKPGRLSAPSSPLFAGRRPKS